MKWRVCRMARSRKPVNPNAQKALDQLKLEVANELGLKDYQNRYKGALTSADNGRVGGHMVRKMIEAQESKFTGQ
ncbi:small acid-soluble spore protein, alpha/beta type [Thermosinus carboxydivorans Nor1]|uniref:Small acid-soluble spore protein, alpha/beta type n=2 Tax=Thermosinus TaxID=261684 RepID=A1HRY4_9FIRM|nr:small acid-soluble spore protein, alpha/beta type [Thermosinus carboxydivorans Nor1]